MEVPAAVEEGVSAATLNHTQQVVYIARHGYRQDWEDPGWRHAMPHLKHDPPLSDEGEQALCVIN